MIGFIFGFFGGGFFGFLIGAVLSANKISRLYSVIRNLIEEKEALENERKR